MPSGIYVRTDLHREHIRESLIGEKNPMFGKKRHHTKDTKQKIAKGVKEAVNKLEVSKKHSESVSGEKNPAFGRTGDKHPMFGVKRPKHSKRMEGDNNPAKRPEVRKKISINNACKRLEVREKIGVAIKKKFKDPEFLKRYNETHSKKPNGPETFLITFLNILLPNKYQYVGDYKVWINGKNPDFINEKDKKLIEHFGPYWHDKEVTGLDRETHENERIEVFKKGGYETLVIWQEDLEDIDKLKEKILSF
jgi:hypothetical protein